MGSRGDGERRSGGAEEMGRWGAEEMGSGGDGEQRSGGAEEMGRKKFSGMVVKFFR
ncbi:MAG: hypothetical protein F6J96_30845 [Symploca sp. SIO1C2]|nr:hypothetical protein [Symploca sp. SIO1C2]